MYPIIKAKVNPKKAPKENQSNRVDNNYSEIRYK